MGTLWASTLVPIMEFAALAGLILFLASEIIPHTPLHGNGVVESIMNALQTAFPKPEKPELEDEAK